MNAPARDEMTGATTAEERLAMVWALTLEGWFLAGREMPGYSRHDTPISFRRQPKSQ